MRALALLSTLALAGCGAAHARVASPSAVRVLDFRFGPAKETVHAGQVVQWHNMGTTLHAVHGPGFFSRAIAPGATWSRRFARVGAYAYLCTLHPRAMRGTIVVVR